MVIYNPKDWWKLIFAFHKSDTFRMILPGIMAVAVYTLVVSFIENYYFRATFKNTTAVHTLVGFVLSLLLVFRTNTAYDRWWEGRRLWGGLVNNSRNLALKLNAILTEQADKELFKNLIVDFVFASKRHLRDEVDNTKLSLNTQASLKLKPVNHIPNIIIKDIFANFQLLVTNKKITDVQMLYINEELRSFTDLLGGCERIKKTPIPYAYSLFLKKVIFLYVFTMPFGFVLEFGNWAAPIVAIIFYIFASIELIAEEVEDPFGRDSNDLPIDSLCLTIKENLDEIF
jgi:ion channel-forming bestrophin family protein